MIALVPVKALAEAKSRLATELDPGERAELVLLLLGRVVGATLEAGFATHVVTPDPIVMRVARDLGAAAIDDGGRDLTGAVRYGLAQVSPAPFVLVVAADLPLITADDLADLAANATPLAIAVARDGTTNAIAASPPTAFTPSYGPGSAARHGGTPVDRPGLVDDLDTVADLARWRLSRCA